MKKNEYLEIIQSKMSDELFDEAELCIEQYKSEYGYDDEIASIDAILNIYNNELSKAEECIQEGLKYNLFNGDLYVTLGNIYELEEEYNRAYLCYEHSLEVEMIEENYRLSVQLMNNLKNENKITLNKFSIVLLTYNNLEYTKVCVDSIKKYNKLNNYEIIIIDNNSIDGTVEWLEEQENIKYILNSENKGFLDRFNQGIEMVGNDNDIFLLNTDTVIMPNSIFNLRMGLYSDDNIGATGAVSNCAEFNQQILSESYEDFNSYIEFSIKNNITNEKVYQERSKLDRYAILIRGNAIKEILDITNNKSSCNDAQEDDLSFMITICGYKLVLCKDSYIHHFEKVNSKVDSSEKSLKIELSVPTDEKMRIVAENILKKYNPSKKVISYQIYEIMNELLELAKECNKHIKDYDFSSFFEIKKNIIKNIKKIYIKFKTINVSKDNLLTKIYCTNIVYSLNNISRMLNSNYTKAAIKMEFEVIPLLEDMRLDFYFHECVDIRDEMQLKTFVNNELKELAGNKYITKSEQCGEYKYDVTITVMAYNKLEYTKACIESLIKYIPDDINYELILCNHGSIDGTKEYFESIGVLKQIDILENGIGWNLVLRIAEGKYCIYISNDVLVTKNAISNLIRCIESDEKIAWAVPTTPNISNNQAIEARYSTFEEMYQFAEKNNVSDKYRWEQRVRLCNPIEIRKNRYFVSKNHEMLSYHHFMNDKEDLKNINSFPDDKYSALLRRNGYKMMLVKDAYCYHFGSVTLRETLSSENDFYNKGRKQFYEVYGIDPWGTGSVFDVTLIDIIDGFEMGNVNILGINCGIGSNPLKIKEKIRENAHNDCVLLWNITDQKEYELDLKGVSDKFNYIDSCENINSFLFEKEFKYIIFEEKFDLYDNPVRIANELLRLLIDDGILILKVNNDKIRNKIKFIYTDVKTIGHWVIIKK